MAKHTILDKIVQRATQLLGSASDFDRIWKKSWRKLLVNLGYPWLVPHDADPNHTPTMKNGEKSHWGVVTGFCVGLNQSSNIKGLSHDGAISQ